MATLTRMGRLQVIDGDAPKGSKKPTRNQTLRRLEDVAQDLPTSDIPGAAIDAAFLALEELGPDASPAEVTAAQTHLRALLAEGLLPDA